VSYPGNSVDKRLYGREGQEARGLGDCCCPNLKNARISEVGVSAPTKSIALHGVLTPEASGAKAQIKPSVNVRAEARTSD